MPETANLSQKRSQSEARDAPDSFSTDLACATREADFILSQNELEALRRPARLGLFPSLRTDSVNRGCCISLLTLAIVVLTKFFRFCFFFIIPRY